MGVPFIERYDKAKSKLDRKLFFTFSEKKKTHMKQEFCDEFGIRLEDYGQDGDTVHCDAQMYKTFLKYSTPEINKATMELEPKG